MKLVPVNTIYEICSKGSMLSYTKKVRILTFRSKNVQSLRNF